MAGIQSLLVGEVCSVDGAVLAEGTGGPHAAAWMGIVAKEATSYLSRCLSACTSASCLSSSSTRAFLPWRNSTRNSLLS